MTKIELKQNLFEIAESEARKFGYIFQEPVAGALIEMISSSVDRLATEDINSSEKVRLAEKNMKMLVQYMIKNMRQRFPMEEGAHYRSLNKSINTNRYLDIRDFGKVRLSICPLWPFC